MTRPQTTTDLEPGRLELHLMPVTTDCQDAQSLLSADELARAARFRRTADRVLFIQAHGLLRRVLSGHSAVAPRQWQFVQGQWGKPALCPQRHPTLQALRFNLSHCAGHVALAVAWGREVGVDIERRDALAQPGELALSVLGPREQQAWQQLGADLSAQQQFLMTRWTLKEAALKALGFGLGQVAPDQLEFQRAADGEDWLAVPSPTQPVAALHDWSRHGWLRSGQVASTHHWAIACERRPGETVSLQRVHHPAPGTAG
jgi:4'-phosphopantetheinyl transferase